MSPKSCHGGGAVNSNLGLSCNDFLASRQSVQAKEYMYRFPIKEGRAARLVIAVASSAALVISLGGCQTTALSDVTGSIGDKGEASASADPRRDVQSLRERFRANPKDPAIAVQYGTALRATGERAQAVAVLEQAAIANPGNKAVLAGYGRALADNGNFQQAYRRAEPGAFAGRSGLANPVGSGRRARSDGPVRGGHGNIMRTP